MRSKRLTMFSIMTILTFSLCQPLALAAGTTAKAGLAQAQESAMKWKADASLVQLLTLSCNTDGTADKWTYVFHSPEAKRGYNVAVSDGKIVQTLDVSASFTDSVDLDFIDSAQAIAEAKKKGLTVKGKSMMMLHVMLKGTKNQGEYWNIVGDMKEGISMIIDAKTGKFFKQQKLE
jgi:hypothetical protein